MSYLISSNDIINNSVDLTNQICESCSSDASDGSKHLHFAYDKTLCEPCGETFLEEKKQELLKMFKETDDE